MFGVPKIQRCFFGGTSKKDYSTLGSNQDPPFMKIPT